MKIAVLCHNIDLNTLNSITSKHSNDTIELYVADAFWKDTKRMLKGINVHLKYHYELIGKYDFIYILDNDYLKDYLFNYSSNILIYKNNEFVPYSKHEDKKQEPQQEEQKQDEAKTKSKAKPKKEDKNENENK